MYASRRLHGSETDNTNDTRLQELATLFLQGICVTCEKCYNVISKQQSAEPAGPDSTSLGEKNIAPPSGLLFKFLHPELCPRDTPVYQLA